MWKLIEAMNWEKYSKEYRGYYEVASNLSETHTKEVIEEMQEFVTARVHELCICIDTYEKANNTRCGEYGGDDSFSDMVCHVVGLGEAKFNEIMNDPKKLNGMEFVESFSYCFPRSDEFEYINQDYHTKRALMAINELTRILNENKPGSSDVMIIKDLMDRFLLMLAGDFKDALQDYNYDTDYDIHYKFESNDCNAMFANYISDFAEFMGK